MSLKSLSEISETTKDTKYGSKKKKKSHPCHILNTLRIKLTAGVSSAAAEQQAVGSPQACAGVPPHRPGGGCPAVPPRDQDAPGCPGIPRDRPGSPGTARDSPGYAGIPRDTLRYPGIPRSSPRPERGRGTVRERPLAAAAARPGRVVPSGVRGVSHSQVSVSIALPRYMECSGCRKLQYPRIALVFISPGSPVPGIPLDPSPLQFQECCLCCHWTVDLWKHKFHFVYSQVSCGTRI